MSLRRRSWVYMLCSSGLGRRLRGLGAQSTDPTRHKEELRAIVDGCEKVRVCLIRR